MPEDSNNRQQSTALIPSPYHSALSPYGNRFTEPDSEQVSTGIPFKHRLWVIRRSLRSIAGFVVVCTIATAIVSYRIKPIYEATATVDVDRRAPSGIVGQDANAIQSNDTEQFLNGQLRLIQSDTVLVPVANAFKMTKAPGVIGFPNLKVGRPQATYLILIAYRSSSPTLSAEFANAVAKSYIEQSIDSRYKATLSLSNFMERQIDELRAKMEHSSQALASFEKQLNMVRPEETNGIVSARLLQLNTEYTTAQAERAKKQAAFESLKTDELPAAEVSGQGDPLRQLVSRLNDANEKLSEAKRQYGKAHPEYRKAADYVGQLTGELQQATTDVMQRVQSEYKEAVNREVILKRSVDETKADFDRLNAKSFEYQSLKREAEADRKLYEELTSKIKEAGINAGFQNNSIRLVDPAQPPGSPVYPNIPRNIELAIICSIFLGVLAAIALDSMDATLRSPDDVERALNAHVIGILPQVKQWRGGWLSPVTQGNSKKLSNGDLKRANAHTSTYEDAVLSLRNSILLGAFEQPLRSLLITSASPAEGKTTTAVHLAIAHAHQKCRTLLIDCDLRRPGVRLQFGMQNGSGLSYVFQNGSSWKDHLKKHPGIPNLDVLLAGSASRRDADLVGRYLPQILQEASNLYELIIVDSPPILGFPEPLQLATSVDGVVLVALAGKTNRKAVAAAMGTLRRLRVNMVGVVLNEVTRNTTVDYYQYGYGYTYGYRYRPDASTSEPGS